MPLWETVATKTLPGEPHCWHVPTDIAMVRWSKKAAGKGRTQKTSEPGVCAIMLTFYWWVDVEGGNVVLVHIAVCLGN